jgi:hypothetical protein
MAEVYNRPPTKPPSEIAVKSPMWTFISELLRSVYLIWDRTRNSVTKLNANTTTVGNVSTGEDDLMTYSLSANQLQAGSCVRISAWGTIANNANSKTLKLYFGSVVLTASLPTSVAETWRVEAVIIASDANAQSYSASIITATSQDAESGTLTETDTDAIEIKCTGEATSTNDITQNGLSVEYLY